MFCSKEFKHTHDRGCYRLFVYEYELDCEYLLIEVVGSKEECGRVIVDNYFNNNVIAFLCYSAKSPFAMMFGPEFLGKSTYEIDKYKICGKSIMENIKKCNIEIIWNKKLECAQNAIR